MSKASYTPKSTPQPGSLTNPPNLVGKRFTPDEFNGRFLINASIQKIVNLPAILASENFVDSKDKLEFKLTLTCNTTLDGIATSISKAPPVIARFTPEMIKKARGSGQFEVAFETVNKDSAAKQNEAVSGNEANNSNKEPPASQTWLIQSEGRNQLVGKCSMKIQLQEFINGSPYRVLFDQTSQIVLQKVYDRKALVFLYGCPIGRIGITLCVSNEDQVGYKKRMDRFLAQFSASPDPNIASSIMAKCDEITTFAYLWKRYGIVDYSARLKRFLSLYSKHLVGQEESLLAKYKMHEEEMFMNLVLDNGPEELDIDAKKRLDAFKSRYYLTNLDVASEANRSFADFLSYMDLQVEKHGSEPDPRTYLFPEPNYKPPPGVGENLLTPPAGNSNNSAKEAARVLQNQLPNQQTIRSDSTAGQTPTKSQGGDFASVSPSAASPNNTATRSRSGTVNSSNNNKKNDAASPAASAPSSQQKQPSNNNGSSSVSAASSPQQITNNNDPASPISKAQQQARSSSNNNNAMFNTTRQNDNNNNNNQFSSASPGNTNSQQQDLWATFISSLTSRRVSSSDIFFLSDDAFISLMSQVGVNSAHRHLVLSEWKRRATENLQLTHFAPSDPSFEAIRNEVLNLTGMQQINLSVLGVVGLRNNEHEATHATRLQLMNTETHKKLERCVYPGEYNNLLRCGERGITAIMSATDSGLCFPRRPFADFEKPAATSLMICDVITGFQTNSTTVKQAAQARSDTVVVSGNGNPADSGLFVRDVRHVLPRYIVHCHVDPTLIACPLHPTKQVEYYVVDQQTFACSNCVVLGPHVGKPIVTLDEALSWARTQLNDLLKDAETVNAAAGEVDRDMHEQLDSVTGDNARRRKEELMESIRREAELRAQDAAKQLDAEMAMQADVLKAQIQRITPLKQSLTQTSKTLLNTVRQSNVARSLEVLQDVSQHYDGNEGRSKVMEVKNTLAIMPQLSHNGSKAPWAYASNGSIANTSNVNNPQHQHNSRARSNSHSNNNSYQDPNNNNSGFGRFMETANTIASARAGSASNSRQATPQDTSLYNKFQSAAASQQQQDHQNNTQSRRNSLPNNSNSNMPSPGGQSTASTRLDMMNNNNNNYSNPNPNQQHTSVQQQGRELLQDGWKAFRRGDASTARSLWTTASERFPNTAIGSRALAYCAEALDKDAVKAAEYYERAIQCDPTDCMTLFNYGVLLEATGHTMRALQLFESAQRLGDIASGKRARAIRQQQLASNDR